MKKQKQERIPEKKKSGFKKISNTLSFIIFLGFSGFVFYTGWVQFSIPEDHYALAFTKTGGYDSYFMKPGEFHWRWENLFPTNMKLHIFELPIKFSSYSLNGTLPSGKDYASILDNPSAFDFSLSMEYQYRMDPDHLLTMIQESSFQFSQINNWYDQIPLKVNEKITNLLQNDLILISSGYSEIETEISDYLSREFPGAIFSYVHIKNWNIPDKVLYEKTRDVYINGIQANREYAAELEKQNAELEKQLNSKIELLKDYGSVLTEYPVLLEYFNLDKEKIDPMIFREVLPNQDPEP